MANCYFIADLHLGHKIAAELRGFDNVDLMHEALISAWNTEVRKKEDIVWILGDVAWHDKDLPILSYLTGRKRVVLGNHDKNVTLNKLDYYCDEIYGPIKAYPGIILSHIPIHPACLEFDWQHNIHGHIHREEDTIIKDIRYTNVNMDVIGMKPIDLNKVRKDFKERQRVDLLRRRVI